MNKHEPFAFMTSSELLRKADELGIELPFQNDISHLFAPIKLGLKKLPNRLVVHPMEGFDADSNGSPSVLTFRRYLRFAEGGSGIIWFEATSVTPDGRSNPRQLMLNSDNLNAFRLLVEQTKNAACRSFGNSHKVYLVLQLNHSGRYSKPEGKPMSLVAQKNPFLDKDTGSVRIVSDEELDKLQDEYVESAKLAMQTGFDAIDIKACHGYLVGELLAAHTRQESRYGGSFENRARFLLEVIQKINERVPGIATAVRLNVYDGVPFPFGFGVSEDGLLDIDLSEAKSLIGKLAELSCTIINVSVGIPYYNPYLGRPFDRTLPNSQAPKEHPLEGIARLLKITGNLQKEFPKVNFVGTGYSWLRQFLPNVGAAILERNEAKFIGLGRSSFAYPDAPKDLMIKGEMNLKKVCIACSRCTELMRHKRITGCVIRDKEIYGTEYKDLQ